MTNPVIKWAAELTVDDHTSVATADFEDFDVFKLLTTKVSSGIDKQKYVNFIEKFVDDPLSYCPLWEPNHPTFYPLMAKATPPEEEADLSKKVFGLIFKFLRIF